MPGNTVVTIFGVLLQMAEKLNTEDGESVRALHAEKGKQAFDGGGAKSMREFGGPVFQVETFGGARRISRETRLAGLCCLGRLLCTRPLDEPARATGR